MKKILSFILTIAMITTMMAILIIPASAASRILDRGSCGNNATWELDQNGNLTITGSGAMSNYSYQNGAPWMDNDISIRSVTISQNITSIGDYAFSESRYSEAVLSFTDVRIPDKCTTIGRYAFSDCTALRTIEIPSKLTTVGYGAFEDCSRLSNVYYEGYESMWNRINIAGENEYLEDARISYNDSYYYNNDNRYYDDDYCYDNNRRYYCDDYYYDNRYYNNRYSYYDDDYYYYDRYYDSNYSSDRYLEWYSWYFDNADPWAKKELDEAFAYRIPPLELNGDVQRKISRLEMAKMAVMAIEAITDCSINTVMEEKDVYPRSSFSDTSDYAVLAVNALGIMSGIGNNKFNPSGTLTRAEAAAIVNRIARLTGLNTSGYRHSFDDVYGHWSSSELGWPSTANIIKGVDNRHFNPDGQLTVEQAILIALRTCKTLNGHLRCFK